MTKIIDFFGIDSDRERTDWTEVHRTQHCPYLNKKCIKIRKSQSEISIGTCTVRYGRASRPVMICPFRLLEKRQIFTDCLHLLTGHEPGNEIHVVPEVGIPGGNIDYFLVSARGRKVRDFVGIELQTLDTTGTVWPERQRFLNSVGIEAEGGDSVKPFGMNWKMTAKTILVQLHHKVQTFEHLNKHLVLVAQDVLYEYMRREFSFDHLTDARTSDPMHFHSYGFFEQEDGNRIEMVSRWSTDSDGIATCLGLQSEANIELNVITDTLETKLSDLTLMTL